MTFATQVIAVRNVAAGEAIGYNGIWRAVRPSRIAVAAVGYGDGYPRALSSRGQVLIRGQRYPVVGRVCMDQFMVDVGPHGTAYNGDEVVLIGRQGEAAIECEAVAQAAGTIPYEILTGLNERIPRDYRGG